MKKVYILFIIVIILSGAGYFASQQNTKEELPQGNALEKYNLIQVTTPKPNDFVQSPLLAKGKARGYWFFEADFPVRVFNAQGNELGIGIAYALDEWMTEDFVAFEVTITFEKPETSYGYILFQKDNPSGLPEHDDELRVPVRF